MKRIPVTILTGFLGAGKTTLLNRMITDQTFSDTAIIVNEFGEVGVDSALITKADERAFALSTGCLCCTVAGDVRLALLQLLEEAELRKGPSFSRVVIETTGLADPAPVLQTFMTNAYMLTRFTLNGVVTLVDMVNGPDALERFEEARRQAAVADLLVVTKEDLARERPEAYNIGAFMAGLRRLNPNADVVNGTNVSAYDVFSLAAFDPAGKPPDVAAWLRFDGHSGETRHGVAKHSHRHAHPTNAHADAATAFCFTATGPADASALFDAVSVLQERLGPDLLRMKGLVEVEGHPGCPLVLHVVGHVASPPRQLDGWPTGVDSTRLVVIAGGPGRALVREIVQSLVPQLIQVPT